MKLSEALAKAKEHVEHEQGTHCMCVEDLIAAAEDLERENAALRLEMKALAEHQVELMDAMDAAKNSTHAMRRVG